MQTHLRRPPAHLSVSLRHHDSPSRSSANSADHSARRKRSMNEDVAVASSLPSSASPVRRTSDVSVHNSDGVQNWFDRSNKRPRLMADHVDNEPPYFLARHSGSDTSNVMDTGPQAAPSAQHYHQVAPDLIQSATKASSADGFRSVIDDLTVENRKLKKRLRTYESSYSTHLEKEKLFEVKIHGLPSKKRRELEETLRSFAASIDASAAAREIRSARDAHHRTSAPSKNTSLSSSASQPVDSAYASISTSAPTSSSTLNPNSADDGGNASQQHQHQKDHNVRSFLHNIPKGLLPKHSMVMTERQKKKLVVRRLEQLFTGKRGAVVGDDSQPLQQQKVSECAAVAEQATSETNQSSCEGLREAHIWPFDMEIDSKKPAKQSSSEDANREMTGTGMSGRASEENADSSPETQQQRPTRPLDLDPDRAQIPSDNVDYLRHLGISAPSFEGGIAADVGADADGWIYLNLLINMAQLHIINVTPDFVRSAVADVSERFQLSGDGRKLRWRGGTEGTRFSSDSGNSSRRQNGSPTDSDSIEELDQKRRSSDLERLGSASGVLHQTHRNPMNVQRGALHYKPLFHHQSSSSAGLTSHSESESHVNEPTDGSATGAGRVPYLRSRGSHSMSGSRARRRNDGPIVFYSGLQFCIDMSGDRGNISTPLHKTAVGRDGFSNHTQSALGCTPRSSAPGISRTPSGSFLPFRPFRDYSKGPDLFQTAEKRPKSPDLVAHEDGDLDISMDWTSAPAPAVSLMSFGASGLGGTQPADHFAVKVETQRTILDESTQVKLSKFSAPGPGAKKFLHTIPRSSLEKFRGVDRVSSEEDIIIGLSSLDAASPSYNAPQKDDLPVRTEITSVRFSRLQPSTLPPPLGYYAGLTSSDSETDGTGSWSCSDISHRKSQKPLEPQPDVAISGFTPPRLRKASDSSEMQDDDFYDDDNESIDMLAEARKADPNIIAAREEEFEIEVGRVLAAGLPVGSTAATVDGGSGADSSSSNDVSSESISDSDSKSD